MATNQDWLPRNHKDLLEQALKTYDYVNAEPQRARMGFAPQTLQGKWFDDTFGPSLGAFEDSMRPWSDPATRTRAQTAAMLEAEKNFKPVYRQLYTAFLKNSPLVTDKDLVLMGLPVRGDKPSPVPVPTTYPVGEVDTSTLRRIAIDFTDSSGEHKKAKPHGVHGAEICWNVFAQEQHVSIEDLVHSSFDTHTPFILDFTEEQRGQRFYYAMRWENTRGEKGPFGPIEPAVIP